MQENKELTASWGMIAKARRRSVSPTWEMSWSSIEIDPSDNSTRRYSAVAHPNSKYHGQGRSGCRVEHTSHDRALTSSSSVRGIITRITVGQWWKAYRPTIPIFSPALIDMEIPFKTGGSSGRYLSTTFLSSTRPDAGHGAGGFLSGTSNAASCSISVA